MFAKRGPGVLDLALAEAWLDDLEVEDAREARPAAEAEADDQLEAHRRDQAPPTGEQPEQRHRRHRRLVEARGARVDHVDVLVWMCRPMRHGSLLPDFALFLRE